jgi:hypothetical protein
VPVPAVPAEVPVPVAPAVPADVPVPAVPALVVPAAPVVPTRRMGLLVQAIMPTTKQDIAINVLFMENISWDSLEMYWVKRAICVPSPALERRRKHSPFPHSREIRPHEISRSKFADA